MDRLTAEEARKIFDENQLDGIDEILSDIRERAKTDTYLNWYGKMTEQIMAELKKLGFEVDYFGSTLRLEDSFYKISW